MKIEKYEDCQIIRNEESIEISFNDDEKSKNTLKNVIFVEFNVGVGDKISSGQIILTMEAMKGTLELKSKVSGIVTEVNKSIEDDPEILKTNPTMWLVRLK
ncbi:hypothetical protein JXM83_04945 [Candidatus Woesearchaeota archaeon]|nr:hypothetical protein [Candidatus Woesearchaeota archaeon]